MKQVVYGGITYEVPDKTRFIAGDNDGDVYWYTHKPEWDEDMWVPTGGSYSRAKVAVSNTLTCLSRVE